MRSRAHFTTCSMCFSCSVITALPCSLELRQYVLRRVLDLRKLVGPAEAQDDVVRAGVDPLAQPLDAACGRPGVVHLVAEHVLRLRAVIALEELEQLRTRGGLIVMQRDGEVG